MARRGKFGRLPRSAPNLENTLISIAREMQDRRDQTIMDAWKNGGTFDGKPVTDKDVLAYWNKREEGLSKDDPNYESIKDNVLQLQYGIEQSKQDLLHVQGKISDNQYAQFFLKWSGKVPRDSEFYRTLQKDAAGLIEQAKASGRAKADKAKADAFNAYQQGITKNDISVGDALIDAAQKMASSSGLTLTGDGEQVLSLLTKDISSNPDKYRTLLDSIKAVNPHWDGQVSSAFFAKSIQEADHGYSLIATRANKDGYATAYAAAAKNQSQVATVAANLKVWPVAQSYNSAYAAFSQVWNDPSSSQMDKMTAAKAFADRVTTFASDPKLDPATKAMLTADATRVLGGDAGDVPSFGQAMIGHKGIDGNTAAQAAYYVQTDALMKAQPGAYVYAPTDRNGQFDPSGSGPLGIVPSGAVGPGAQLVAVPQLGGQAIMAAIAPHSVYVSDPNDPHASPKLVGYALSYSVGGKTIQMYGYNGSDGVGHWSLSQPWADGVTQAVDGKGDVYLTMPSPAPADIAAQAAQIDAKYGTHLVAQLKAGSTDPKDKVTRYGGSNGKTETGSTEVTLSNGKFTVTDSENQIDPKTGKVTETTKTPVQLFTTPFDPTTAISGSRKAQPEIPGVTFSSPVAASMSANPESVDQVGHLAADPLFQQAFVQQTMTALGTQNMLDPRIASAWSTLTSAANHVAANSSGSPDDRMDPAFRKDLTYPGADAANKAANAGSMTLNFGNGQLKLPNLPSYIGQKNLDLSGVGGIAKAGADFLAPVLGIANPFATPGGVTPTPAAGPGAPKTTITPTAPITPSGTSMGTPTITPVQGVPLPPPTGGHPTDYGRGK